MNNIYFKTIQNVLSVLKMHVNLNNMFVHVMIECGMTSL